MRAKQLTITDGVAIFVGVILGSGIFVAPAMIATAMPGAGSAVLLWIIGGAVAACGAFVYAECGARLPQSGGFFVYYRNAFGEPFAFVGGYAAICLTYPASLAAITMLLASYAGRAWEPLQAHPKLVAIAALAIAAAINIGGLGSGALSQKILTSIKVLVLALVCLAALWAGGNDLSPSEPLFSVASENFFPALLAAMVSMLWTYDGWSDITLITGDIRNPGRALVRIVGIGIAILVTIYGLVHWSITSVLGPAKAAVSKGVVAEAVGSQFGGAGEQWVALLVVICTLGAVTALVLTSSRLAVAMSKTAMLPSVFGKHMPIVQSPVVAIGFLFAAALVFILSGSFWDVLSLFSFAIWLFYGLTASALLLFRLRAVGRADAFRHIVFRLAPFVVLLMSLAMTVGQIIESPWRSLLGGGLFGVGFLVYAGWRLFNVKEAT
jgi:APA family basic amino acid/polyamine antiporter